MVYYYPHSPWKGPNGGLFGEGTVAARSCVIRLDGTATTTDTGNTAQSDEEKLKEKAMRVCVELGLSTEWFTMVTGWQGWKKDKPSSKIPLKMALKSHLQLYPSSDLCQCPIFIFSIF